MSESFGNIPRARRLVTDGEGRISLLVSREGAETRLELGPQRREDNT